MSFVNSYLYLSFYKLKNVLMYDLKFVFCLASIILFLKINLILHSENFHYENICNLKENSVNYYSYYFVMIHNNSNVSAFFLQ